MKFLTYFTWRSTKVSPAETFERSDCLQSQTHSSIQTWLFAFTRALGRICKKRKMGKDWVQRSRQMKQKATAAAAEIFPCQNNGDVFMSPVNYRDGFVASRLYTDFLLFITAGTWCYFLPFCRCFFFIFAQKLSEGDQRQPIFTHAQCRSSKRRERHLVPPNLSL